MTDIVKLAIAEYVASERRYKARRNRNGFRSHEACDIPCDQCGADQCADYKDYIFYSKKTRNLQRRLKRALAKAASDCEIDDMPF
jgi:hypothetical protein